MAGNTAQTRPLHEPDLVVAAREIVRTETRRLYAFLAAAVGSGIAAVSALLAGHSGAANVIMLGCAAIVAVMAVIISLNKVGPRARRIIQTYETFLIETLDLDASAALNAPKDPRWHEATAMIATLDKEETAAVELRDEIRTLLRDADLVRESIELDRQMQDGEGDHAERLESIRAHVDTRVEAAMGALRKMADA